MVLAVGGQGGGQLINHLHLQTITQKEVVIATIVDFQFPSYVSKFN